MPGCQTARQASELQRQGVFLAVAVVNLINLKQVFLVSGQGQSGGLSAAVDGQGVHLA